MRIITKSAYLLFLIVILVLFAQKPALAQIGAGYGTVPIASPPGNTIVPPNNGSSNTYTAIETTNKQGNRIIVGYTTPQKQAYYLVAQVNYSSLNGVGTSTNYLFATTDHKNFSVVFDDDTEYLIADTYQDTGTAGNTYTSSTDKNALFSYPSDGGAFPDFNYTYSPGTISITGLNSLKPPSGDNITTDLLGGTNDLTQDITIEADLYDASGPFVNKELATYDNSAQPTSASANFSGGTGIYVLTEQDLRNQLYQNTSDSNFQNQLDALPNQIVICAHKGIGQGGSSPNSAPYVQGSTTLNIQNFTTQDTSSSTQTWTYPSSVNITSSISNSQSCGTKEDSSVGQQAIAGAATVASTFWSGIGTILVSVLTYIANMIQELIIQLSVTLIGIASRGIPI